jgi:hypothetical protein
MLLAHDISVEELKDWQSEDLYRPVRPLLYGTYLILKTLTSDQINEAIQEMGGNNLK